MSEKDYLKVVFSKEEYERIVRAAKELGFKDAHKLTEAAIESLAGKYGVKVSSS